MSSQQASATAGDNGATTPLSQEMQQLYQLASNAWQQGDLKQVGAAAQRMLQIDESFAPAYGFMADVYERLGNEDKAVSFLDIGLRFHPNDYAFCFKRGQLAYLRKEWEVCETYLSRAHQLQPGQVLPLALLGDAYAAQQKKNECVNAFKQARAIEDSAVVDEHEGLAMMSFGNLSLAEDRFNAILKRNPDDLRGKLHMSKVLIYTDRLDQADPLLRDVLSANEANHEAHYFAAVWYMKREDKQTAAKHAYRAVQLKDGRDSYELLLISLLKELGYLEDCERVLRHVLARDPDNLPALQTLAYILVPLKKTDEAKQIIREVLARAPDDAGLKHIQDAIEGRNTAAPDDAYVASLFDHYAEKFDKHLLGALSYQTPYVMRDLIEKVAGENNITLGEQSLLDLGCGTGLGAEVLEKHTKHRVGVDLSPKMLEKAQEKSLYDGLHADNIVDYMNGDQASYDIIAALDVLVYIGDLNPLFDVTPACLNAGGLFAISVEQAEDAGEEGYVLRHSGRYAHKADYVKALAEKAGLQLLAQEASVLRKEGGQDMPGWLFIFKK